MRSLFIFFGIVPPSTSEPGVRFIKLIGGSTEGILISFDPAHRAVHYPPDRRFRIWIRPSILIGIGIAILSVIVATWIEVAVAGLPRVPAVPQIYPDHQRLFRRLKQRTFGIFMENRWSYDTKRNYGSQVRSMTIRFDFKLAVQFVQVLAHSG